MVQASSRTVLLVFGPYEDDPPCCVGIGAQTTWANAGDAPTPTRVLNIHGSTHSNTWCSALQYLSTLTMAVHSHVAARWGRDATSLLCTPRAASHWVLYSKRSNAATVFVWYVHPSPPKQLCSPARQALQKWQLQHTAQNNNCEANHKASNVAEHRAAHKRVPQRPHAPPCAQRGCVDRAAVGSHAQNKMTPVTAMSVYTLALTLKCSLASPIACCTAP